MGIWDFVGKRPKGDYWESALLKAFTLIFSQNIGDKDKAGCSFIKGIRPIQLKKFLLDKLKVSMFDAIDDSVYDELITNSSHDAL